jgi:hypothetical protein
LERAWQVTGGQASQAKAVCEKPKPRPLAEQVVAGESQRAMDLIRIILR